MCLKYIVRLIVYSGVDSGPVEKNKNKKNINRASLPDPTDVVEGGL